MRSTSLSATHNLLVHSLSKVFWLLCSIAMAWATSTLRFVYSIVVWSGLRTILYHFNTGYIFTLKLFLCHYHCRLNRVFGSPLTHFQAEARCCPHSLLFYDLSSSCERTERMLMVTIFSCLNRWRKDIVAFVDRKIYDSVRMRRSTGAMGWSSCPNVTGVQKQIQKCQMRSLFDDGWGWGQDGFAHNGHRSSCVLWWLVFGTLDSPNLPGWTSSACGWVGDVMLLRLIDTNGGFAFNKSGKYFGFGL